ncbi:TPA: hypothetical protein QDA71_002462 [Burkholderia vietnamiensis]|uniref:hypothetical protein n=1 Tax=Burkholderia TaxID=32008 RepID=UPI00158C23C6|nr:MULTISPECIES: hypothetical protein [Burkholderia]HDR8945469.1 hypothetical protein [Burkholderia vietnamiensis]HDR9206702.1 hypothetical protein [Burkholderia vietnamiensis]
MTTPLHAHVAVVERGLRTVNNHAMIVVPVIVSFPNQSQMKVSVYAHECYGSFSQQSLQATFGEPVVQAMRAAIVALYHDTQPVPMPIYEAETFKHIIALAQAEIDRYFTQAYAWHVDPESV